MRDEEVTLTLAPGVGQVGWDEVGGLWSSSERSLLSLHVWGAGRSTNIPELGFGAARIHFGHRFSWPGCSSKKSDLAPVIPTHLTLSPGDSFLGSSPQLSLWDC